MTTRASTLPTAFEEIVLSRRSIRAFKDRPVESEKVKAVVEAAHAAPCAGGLQSYRIVCVTRPKDRRELARAASGQEFVGQAPVIVVFLADLPRSSDKFGEQRARLFAIQDATIACAYPQLRAHDMGLGSTWVGPSTRRKSLARWAGTRILFRWPSCRWGMATKVPRRRPAADSTAWFVTWKRACDRSGSPEVSRIDP